MTLYTRSEEVVHSITHGIGMVLAIVGLVVLTVLASLRGDAWHVVSCSLFGATLVLLYCASTLYHAIPGPRIKNVLRTLDHSAIFLLIAGTYTPFALVTLRGPWGWSLFGVVWGLAALGIAFEWAAPGRWPTLSLVLYVLTGWVALVAIKPLFDALPLGGFLLLIGGGVGYTAGVLFFVWERLPFNHAVWHVFVLLGSVLHYWAVLLYVVPGPPSS